MTALRQLDPDKVIPGINHCQKSAWIGPWASTALDLPSEITLDAGTQGNHTGSHGSRGVNLAKSSQSSNLARQQFFLVDPQALQYTSGVDRAMYTKLLNLRHTLQSALKCAPCVLDE